MVSGRVPKFKSQQQTFAANCAACHQLVPFHADQLSALKKKKMKWLRVVRLKLQRGRKKTATTTECQIAQKE